jgi:V-type H+-transporting ATPase subunit a
LLSLFKLKDEAKQYIQQTKMHLKEYLKQINLMPDSEYSLVKVFKWFIIKERSIYTELNKLRDGEKLLMGLFWCPTKLQATLTDKIRDIKERKNEGLLVQVITDFNDEVFTRPSYLETNEFTWPFQEIVNTYGVP